MMPILRLVYFLKNKKSLRTEGPWAWAEVKSINPPITVSYWLSNLFAEIVSTIKYRCQDTRKINMMRSRKYLRF